METNKETNKNQNNTLILVVIFITIFILGFISYWRMKDFEKGLREVEIPNLEIPEIKFPFPLPQQNQESREKREFICPERRLKLYYSTAWTEKNEEFLQILKQNMPKDGPEILFFAQKTNFIPQTNEMSFSLLSVQKMKIQTGTTSEDIVEKIKKWAKETGIEEVEIVNLETKNEQTLFSAKYKKTNQPIMFSKTKIILLENNAYLISIITEERHWSDFEIEAKEILDSIQLL